MPRDPGFRECQCCRGSYVKGDAPSRTCPTCRLAGCDLVAGNWKRPEDCALRQRNKRAGFKRRTA